MLCQYCCKDLKNNGALVKHQNGCKFNPNRKFYESNFRFLTKEQILNNKIKSEESRIKNLKSQPFELWGRKLKEPLILEEQNGCCAECKNEKVWNGKPLIFELDHIDGNNQNNKRENLRLLCPNCHSQTETWKGRNINSGKKKVTDEELINALKVSKNIREALLKVGLTGKGGNYKRAKLLQKGFVEELEYSSDLKSDAFKD